MKIPVICPQCGETRLLKPADAKRAKLCRRCHLTNIAPKGYAATRAKHGEKSATQKWRAWRLDNPSDLERLVIAALESLYIQYEREYWLEHGRRVYLADFAVPVADELFFIEVNGAYIHRRHEQRDQIKPDYLTKHLNAPVLVLEERDIKARYARDREHVAQKLRERIALFLGVKPDSDNG